MFSPIPNHVQQALARLMTQYQNSPNLQNMMAALINPLQDIEGVLTDMNDLRYLPLATGAQLDLIGVIVGISRPTGMSDANYLLLIYGQIKINTSQGQPEQMIQAFILFAGVSMVILAEFQNASFLFESVYVPPNQAAVDSLITTLNGAKPAGVRIDGIVSYDPDMAFAYDGPLSGFGYDDGSQTVGGKYAELYQFIGGGFAYDGDDPTGLGYGSLLDPLCGGAYLT